MVLQINAIVPRRKQCFFDCFSLLLVGMGAPNLFSVEFTRNQVSIELWPGHGLGALILLLFDPSFTELR